MVSPPVLDAVVIGAGSAGLGMSFLLAQAGMRHRLLERGRIGETWRRQRWDSFQMNTPNWSTAIPGTPYHGGEPDGFYSRDQFVGMLEDHASRQLTRRDRHAGARARYWRSARCHLLPRHYAARDRADAQRDHRHRKPEPSQATRARAVSTGRSTPAAHSRLPERGCPAGR